MNPQIKHRYTDAVLFEGESGMTTRQMLEKAMSKHTPGPWLAREPNGKGRGWLAGPAWLGANTYSEECEANARLIAAAPELIKELQSILEDIDSDHGNDHDYSKTRTLISRVTGDVL